MMGRQTGDQASLFYEFRLADRIPKDHLLRRINVVVGPVLDGVRGQRQLFESVVAACMAAGLVKGEGFAVDASVMEANASRYHGKAPDEIVWAEPERQTRAVREFSRA